MQQFHVLAGLCAVSQIETHGGFPADFIEPPKNWPSNLPDLKSYGLFNSGRSSADGIPHLSEY